MSSIRSKTSRRKAKNKLCIVQGILDILAHLLRRTLVMENESVARSPEKPRALNVYCQGYMKVKRKNRLTSRTKYVVLNKDVLKVYCDKQDAMSRESPLALYHIVNCRMEPSKKLCFRIQSTEEETLWLSAHNRREFAKWITAFNKLSMHLDVFESELDCPNESEEEEGSSFSSSSSSSEDKKKVSFHESVRVRMIPSLSREEVEELFYSERDVVKFSHNAENIFLRTGDAMLSVIASVK